MKKILPVALIVICYLISFVQLNAQAISLIPNPSPSDGGYYGNPIAIGSTLYFRYRNAAGKYELAKYDGSTLTVIANPSASDPGFDFSVPPVAVGSTLYFRYSNAAGKYQLAKYDGNTLTMIANPSASDLGYYDKPLVIGNTLYFQYLNASGKYLLGKYDGITLSVIPNSSINDPGYNTSPIAIGNTLYFQYKNAAGNYQLAKYDGTTLLVIGNPNTTDLGYLGNLIAIGNVLYFRYQTSTGKYSLAKYDGITISLINNLSVNDPGYFGWPPAVVDNILYFCYSNAAGKYQLAKYDGSNLTVINNPSTTDNGYIGNSLAIGSILYFRYWNAANKYQLAKYDGTTLAVIPNTSASDIGYDQDPISIGNTLYFSYRNAIGNYQLAKYDGSNLTVIANPSTAHQGYNGYPTTMGNSLYFKYNSGLSYQLAKYDGSTLSVITNPSVSDYGYSGGLPIIQGSTLYFLYRNADGKNQLAKYDGTNLTVIPNPSINDPGYYINAIFIGSTLYFQYLNAASKYQLATLLPPTWTGATSTTWATATNWNGNTVPSSTDSVVIPSTGVTNEPVISTATSLGSLTVQPGRTLTVNNTLTTTGGLTLQSNAAGTAQIGTSTGNINGNVNVERYIPSNNRKKYTLVTSPVNNPTIYNAWQEGGINTNTGYGIQITGAAAGNGFDGQSASGKPSIFTYNDANVTGSKWVGLGNTNSSTLGVGKGYLLYVRGDRAENRPVTGNTSNTTLRATGTLSSGTFTTSGLTTGANKYNLIANPFPCAVDWLSAGVTKTQLAGSFTVYDPNLGVFVTSDGVTLSPSVASQQQLRYIQSGQALFIQNNGTGTAPSLSIAETAKTTSVATATANTVFGNEEAPAKLDLNIYKMQDSAFVDGAVALFGSNYHANVDGQDAAKFSNFNETVALQRNQQLLSIEKRPLAQNDTLFVNLANFSKSQYRLNIDGTGFTAGNAMLQDKFTNTRLPLNLAGKTNYDFTINNETASSVADRFMVVFGGTANGSVADVADNQLFLKLSPNPVKGQLQVIFKTATANNTTVTITNGLGQVVKKASGGNTTTGNINVDVSKLAAGVYNVQLLSGGKQVATQKLVKE